MKHFYNGENGFMITSLIQYQELANGFINEQRYDGVMDYHTNTALGLTGESGEYADLIKKVRFHGHEYDEATQIKLAKELGDVLWYVAQGCKALGVTLADVASLNIQKLTDRHGGSTFSELASKTKDETKEAQPVVDKSPCQHLGIWRYGKDSVRYCSDCSEPMIPLIQELEAVNAVNSIKLQDRERSLCRFEDKCLSEESFKARKALESYHSWKERKTGVVEKGDIIWLREKKQSLGEIVAGEKSSDTRGQFVDAESVYALNHSVSLFYCVARRKVFVEKENYNDVKEFAKAIENIQEGYVLVPVESYGDDFLQGDDLAWNAGSGKFEGFDAGFYQNKWRIKSFIAVVRKSEAVD